MDKPETQAPAPDAPQPTPEAKAEVAAAAAAVAQEKIVGARRREAAKAAAEHAKPRRVGPLRAVHRTLLDRHRAAQEPLVAELERLAARQRELQVQLSTEARGVLVAIAEDLGEEIGRHEVPRPVDDHEDGEVYLELTRVTVAR